MSNPQCVEPAKDISLTVCKVSEMSQISGLRKRALRRYHRIGLLSPEIRLESGRHLYTRHDLIQLERLAVMQMLGLSRSEIKDCLHTEERALREELQLQREILLEKRRRLNRAIYFIEYAEQVNRDPHSDDWHHLGKVVEAIQSVRDPEWFRRFYILGTMQKENGSGILIEKSWC